MAKHIFFDALWAYGKQPSKCLLTPFGNDKLLDVDTEDPFFDSTLYKKALTRSQWKPINFLSITEKAIVRATMPEILPGLTGFGGYGFDKDGNFYADYYDGSVRDFNMAIEEGKTDFSDERHILTRLKADTLKLDAVVIDSYGGQNPYLLATRTTTGENQRHSAAAAIYTLLCYLVSKGAGNPVADTLREHWKEITEGYSVSDFSSFYRGMRALDVDLYTLFSYAEEVKKKMGDMLIEPMQYNTDTFDLLDIASGEIECTEFHGDSKLLRGDIPKAKTTRIRGMKKLKTMKELLGSKEYQLGIPLSEEEEALVPGGFEDFIPSEIVLDVAKEVKASSGDPVPARNFLFTGETGTGKTTESQMLATLLHLPYRSMNLSSDKLSSDILVSCLPNPYKADKKELLTLIKSWPSALSIAMDPVAAYTSITGIVKEDATEEDINLAKAEALFEATKKGNDFLYVDSPFVETFRKGGLVELQEANSCKAAILKSLNEALDDLNVLHLPTGEVVHRNPNCIVVVTANVGAGYEGVQAFSNDFIARFHQADLFELPNDETLAERVMSRSGYHDEKTVLKMIKVMHGIQKILLETKGDYGSCSPRGLIAWARKTKNTGDVYTAALKTIIGLATQDPEIRTELKNALETEFVPSM